MVDSQYMYSDLATKVYLRLKEMIISGELKPGEKLIQEDLAVALGVSRTPLIQAISRLSQENLVRTTPRRGSFVVSITPVEILDAFEISCSLEPLAAALLAQRIQADVESSLSKNIKAQLEAMEKGDLALFNDLDIEFHNLIIFNSGNSYMKSIMSIFSSPIYSKEALLKDMDERFFEHRGIFTSILQHDSQSAKNAMEYHKNLLQEGKLKKLLIKGENDATN